MKIKSFVKRTICIILSVALLFFGVSNSYLSPHKMDTVQATGAEIVAVAGISASTLFQICLFVGTTAVTLWGIGELIDNKDEIAQVGKNLIDSATSLPDGWAFKMTSVGGQDYVFGTEALQEVQDTQWEVIQGGSPNNNNDDNNDDDDNNKNKFKLPTKSSNELVGSWLALGGVWLTDLASKWYNNYVNDSMTDADKAVIEPIISGRFTDADLVKQWSGDNYNFNISIKYEYDYINPSTNEVTHCIDIYNIEQTIDYPLCYAYTVATATNGATSYNFKGYKRYLNKWKTASFSGKLIYIRPEGVNTRDFTSSQSLSITDNNNSDNYYSHNVKIMYDSNVPVFSSVEDATAYVTATLNGENAINYAKTYREADWLTDDWSGVLIDPLTNINLTLSQLLDVAKALGLKAVGNNLRPEELADLIANSLPKINPELLPGISTEPAIVTNPDLVPLYYPNADAHPQPGIDIEPDPVPDPVPVPDPEPTEPIDSEEITPEESVDETKENLKDIVGGFKNKFPFCLPWDLQYLYSILADNPKTPVFKLPLVLERYGIHEDIVIDMSNFEGLSKISRLFFTLLYIYGLINFTVKTVLVRKEE